ncbi:FAD-dependent oxidoreductase [Acuticoccus mangrovi]|uniref:FAD-dependent oxidoreductase n=1 Tax=Acuticoccus mangrovi TaxID=2796142 RepID=A0A934MJ35_9HYPH|nr:FAD-dependent oxidoreductase [Acuticoccus mangrovi]MBJ3777851.1 FAD-dependent oxidoreductase [Acuticoccus mangrovi]
MTNRLAADVLICGAGAAGLTLAIDLARRGISFRLIDKAADPFPGSRGKGIQPRTQEIFEDLGVLDKAVAAGGRYPPQRTYHDDGSVTDAAMAEPAEPTPAEPYQMPLMVPQFVTERLLRDRLSEFGVDVEAGRTLVGFEQDGDGVTARITSAEGTETLRVGWLIGADGGRSFVRHALGIAFPGHTLGVRAIVADVALEGLSRGLAHRFARGGAMSEQVSITPLAGTDLFQIQGPVPMDGDVDLTATGLTALLARRTGRDDIAVRSVAWASAYEMSARLAERYRAGRVLLVGDAAHVHPPTGGQGLNTSVQDAYNLGFKLAAVIAGAGDDILATYEAERRPVAEDMLRLATRLLDAQTQGAMRRGREVRQLDIGYRGSPLTVEALDRRRGLRAGDRAPDARLHGAAGQPSRLFHLFKGPHWTLLVQAGGHGAIAPRANLHIHVIGPAGDILDTSGDIAAAYGLAPGECALVRPDGYVGAILGADDTAALDAYFPALGVVAHPARPVTTTEVSPHG